MALPMSADQQGDPIRDRRDAPWCWQGRDALDRITAAMAGTGETATALVVYVALTHSANTAEQCWPKINTLAAKWGIGTSTIQRRLRDLEQLGLISVTGCISERGDTSNTYTLLNTPKEPPAANWRELPPPVRPLVHLETSQRSPRPATSPKHRNGPEIGQNTRAMHSHGDRARGVTMTVPASHQQEGRGVMVTAPLKDRLTNNSEQKPLIDLASLDDFINDAPPIAGTITPPGLPAVILWATLVDRIAPFAPVATIASLRTCYLAGDSARLVAVAPAHHIAKQLAAKTEIPLREAAKLIVSRSTNFDFWLGGN